ncbi:hypothetical protein GCM10027600_42640 [Nocardioides ginsengisegetis]
MNVNEGSVPLGKLAKWGLTALVAAFMGSAWAAWLLGTESAWMMLGLTGCVASAAAAVAHVRCYAVQTCRLVRMNADSLAELTVRDPVRPLR